MERAQLVWRRAMALAGGVGPGDRYLVMLDLLRTARHDPTMMRHALALGRTQLDAAPTDGATRAAVRILSSTVSWLGKRPAEGEIGTAASP